MLVQEAQHFDLILLKEYVVSVIMYIIYVLSPPISPMFPLSPYTILLPFGLLSHLLPNVYTVLGEIIY